MIRRPPNRGQSSHSRTSGRHRCGRDLVAAMPAAGPRTPPGDHPDLVGHCPTFLCPSGHNKRSGEACRVHRQLTRYQVTNTACIAKPSWLESRWEQDLKVMAFGRCEESVYHRGIRRSGGQSGWCRRGHTFPRLLYEAFKVACRGYNHQHSANSASGILKGVGAALWDVGELPC